MKFENWDNLGKAVRTSQHLFLQSRTVRTPKFYEVFGRRLCKMEKPSARSQSCSRMPHDSDTSYKEADTRHVFCKSKWPYSSASKLRSAPKPLRNILMLRSKQSEVSLGISQGPLGREIWTGFWKGPLFFCTVGMPH